MSESSRTVAVIPARGGSSRIPRKNLRMVAGKPLIAHAIAQADAADHVDRTIVSTDDTEISDVAREYGGDVPFVRPDELATDTASTAGVITHALDWLVSQGDNYETICVVQTTSPLRRHEDIDGALSTLKESGASSVVSVAEYITAPRWAVEMDDDGYLREYGENALWTDAPDRSQDLPALMHPNGAIFASSVESWYQHESFYTPETIGYEMPPIRSFDVDDPWELQLIRHLYSMVHE